MKKHKHIVIYKFPYVPYKTEKKSFTNQLVSAGFDSQKYYNSGISLDNGS